MRVSTGEISRVAFHRIELWMMDIDKGVLRWERVRVRERGLVV